MAVQPVARTRPESPKSAIPRSPSASADAQQCLSVGKTFYRHSQHTQRRQKQNHNPLPTLTAHSVSAEASTDTHDTLTVGRRWGSTVCWVCNRDAPFTYALGWVPPVIGMTTGPLFATGVPLAALSLSIRPAISRACSSNVGTIWSSGTVSMTLPLMKI